MEMVSSVPVAQQAMMVMTIRTPKITKISWGSMPPDLPILNGCRAVVFSTSGNDIVPQMEKVMYGPAFAITKVSKLSAGAGEKLTC